MDAINFLLTPFVACLILLLINVYFGIHVIKREIIFIDISMAQIAALGGAVAMVIFQSAHPEASYEHAEHNTFSYLFSFGFITLAAVLFAFLKNKKNTVPLEALIGIAYAVATTGTVIILDKGAGGDVHVHNMLIGSILWTSWHDITRLSVVVLLVGIFHYIFRKKFFRLSDNYLSSEKSLNNQLFWDFMFYLSFGLVIIEAINMAGILTVFALLILPASFSALISAGWQSRILTGWAVGLIVIILGLFLSFKMDVPSSPVFIVLLAIFLLVGFVVKRFILKPGKK
ncbi:MAG: metal ABC transporter permease [Bacteroidales bacterium]|nr:metal ABC transporter permease [Bacteroidales bacterium]